MQEETVFIGDLSFHCDENDISRLFQPYGTIQSIIIRRSRNGESLRYGFVRILSDNLQMILDDLHGKKFMGRRLRYDT
jgi:RNA recognition motif-containing protein